MAQGNDNEVRERRFHDTLSALEEVVAGVAGVPTAILRDSRIQRFEFTFEAVWKLLAAIAEDEGVDASTPRKAFQAAIRAGLLDASDEGAAWEMLRYRNLTVHTYDEDLAIEVEGFVTGSGIELFRKLSSRAGLRT
ncbi:MAG: nucleotidyltransferase substrate binding protein [Deltaproteobacteria bacterium]|nr:nucleotidyltransferase substrate binding protein [Deltaproteobacteria bacterium]